MALLILTQRLNYTLLLSIALFLYFLGLSLSAYSPLIDSPSAAVTVRNLPTFGFIFVVAGYIFAKKNMNMPIFYALCFAALGIILQLVEGYIIMRSGGYFSSHDFLLGTIPFAMGVFFLALKSNSKKLMRISTLGPAVLAMYCVHIFFLRAVESVIDEKSIILMIFTAMATVILSTLAGLFLCRIPVIKRFCS